MAINAATLDTASGITIKSFREIREALEKDFKGTFGYDLNTSSSSPDGMLIDLFAYAAMEAAQTVQAALANLDVATAEGVFLDRIATIAGIARDPGEPDASLRDRIGTAEFGGMATFDGMLTYLRDKLGGGLSVPKPNSDDDLAKIDGRTGDIQTVGKVKGFGAEFSSIDIAGRAKAVTFEGKVETNDISAKDSSKPIYVSAISGFNITGKSSVSGDFSSGSLKTGKIAYENLNLNDNMGIAPVLPYFLDNSGTGIKNLSEILAEAPKGARITFINNSGKDKEYHFTTTDVEGVAGGYFTLKAGRAVDIIVNNVLSVSQVSLLPIGIDYEEGGNL